MKSIDKYRGCLIGGAAGDALGYAVEFLSEGMIFSRYGESGITEYELTNGVAQISDDTQMSLFTANGLLYAAAHAMTENFAGCIELCYKDWLKTQRESFPVDTGKCCAWLMNEQRLFSSRAPGVTCMSALMADKCGTMTEPINDSKGCGGVMRVAPIGLYFEDGSMPLEEIDRIGAEAAALTHGHELGYIPAAALVHVISLAAHNDGMALLDAVLDMRKTVSRQFANAEHIGELLELIDRAIELSQADVDDNEAIHALGEGWVGDEVLAIALYCALKHSHDFDRAIIAAVNHKGDSDSTGAITGNILGAYLGLGKIPQKYTDKLELKDVIFEIADDLYNDCRDDTWNNKYIAHSYQKN